MFIVHFCNSWCTCYVVSNILKKWYAFLSVAYIIYTYICTNAVVWNFFICFFHWNVICLEICSLHIVYVKCYEEHNYNYMWTEWWEYILHISVLCISNDFYFYISGGYKSTHDVCTKHIQSVVVVTCLSSQSVLWFFFFQYIIYYT